MAAYKSLRNILIAGGPTVLAIAVAPVAGQQPIVPAVMVKPAKQEPPGLTQPPVPEGTSQAPALPPTDSGGGLGVGEFSPVAATQQSPASPASQTVANTPQTSSTAPTDVGDFLAKSEEALGFEVQRRSPIVTDPFIRGYRTGQLTTYLDGGWAYPARTDLDTIVSKIDATNIRDVLIVKGPYNVRYGSGLAFLDIATITPPRYDGCGFENHGHILSGYKTNGQQLRERGELYGGSQTAGYRIGYTLGVGNDYTVPNDFIFRDYNTNQTVNFGDKIPSSYNTQSIDYAFGFDLTPNSTLTLYGMNLFQRNVELPGFPFDFRRLEAQAYSVRYELRDQPHFDKFTWDSWYAYTHFTGDNGVRIGAQGTLEANTFYGKRQFYYNPLINPQLPPPHDTRGESFAFPLLAINVDGGAMTTGTRQFLTWGHPKELEFNVGWDVRYLSQRNDEYDVLSAVANGLDITNYPIPRSHIFSRGLFADATAQPSENWIVKSGARVDIANVDVDAFKQGLTPEQIKSILGNDNLNHEYLMWNGYLSSEYKLGKEVSLLAGVGTGQRPPNLTELYAIQPYMAQIQRTFNFFTGNPGLLPEQALQVDTGFRSDFQWFRAGATGFASWIHNYITYQPTYNSLPPSVSQFTQEDGQPGPGNNRDSMGFIYTNTDLALLFGFEAYSEVNLTSWLTAFGTASYVHGTDLSRGDRVTQDQINGGLFTSIPDSEPLPSIVPLDTRMGLRVHESSLTPRWSVDFSARYAAAQNRVARSLGEIPTNSFTVYDLRTFWQVNDRWTLNAGIENIFDKFYREHLDIVTGRGVYQPGRNYYFVVEMRF